MRMKSPKVHELKCWPPFYWEVERGEKTFELRYNDRDYQVDELVWLREWVPSQEVAPSYDAEAGGWHDPGYTGESCLLRITYVLKNVPIEHHPGLQPGYVILGVEVVKLVPVN